MSNQDKQTLTQVYSKLFSITTAFNIGLLAPATQAQNYWETSSNYTTNNHASKILDSPVLRKQKPQAETDKEPLDFSSLGRSGQQTAGESRGSCSQVETPLVAIAPKSNVSKTRTSHPQWWFYSSYTPSQITKVEFVVQNQQRRDILRENLTDISPNFFKAAIPENHPGIEANLWYRWYLKIYCREDNTVPLFVYGWVQKVVPEAKNETGNRSSLAIIEYAEQDFWLDAVNLLLESTVSETQNSQQHQMWQQIVGSPEIGLDLPFPSTDSIVIK